jgi:hypothetical protein
MRASREAVLHFQGNVVACVAAISWISSISSMSAVPLVVGAVWVHISSFLWRIWPSLVLSIGYLVWIIQSKQWGNVIALHWMLLALIFMYFGSCLIRFKVSKDQKNSGTSFGPLSLRISLAFTWIVIFLLLTGVVEFQVQILFLFSSFAGWILCVVFENRDSVLKVVQSWNLVSLDPASQVFLGLYLAVNVGLFIEAWIRWSRIANDLHLSPWAPFAKSHGQLLNFNSALVILPVLRKLMNMMNNWLVSNLIRYPWMRNKFPLHSMLQRNLEFHKVVVGVVSYAVCGHVCGHLLNIFYSVESMHVTLSVFPSQIGISPWISGQLILVALLIILCGGANVIRRLDFEVFWISHHFFIIYVGFLFIHGPRFKYWGLASCALYLIDRILRRHVESSNKVLLTGVSWIKPVLCVKFKADSTSEFSFQEGQYVYLNCPHISKIQWHPFTISSASENAQDEVTLHIKVVDRGWTEELKNYLSLLSQSDQVERQSERFSFDLYGQDDQVVFQMNQIDQTLSSGYLPELSSIVSKDPKLKAELRKFLYMCTKKGKFVGPDSLPIIQVDGPHAAPSQHYQTYPHLLLVGSGIGLTPSAAILQSLVNHKWKKTVGGSKDCPNPCETVRFVWICPLDDVLGYEWFSELLEHLDSTFERDSKLELISSRCILEIFIHVTGKNAPVEHEEKGLSHGTSLIKKMKAKSPSKHLRTITILDGRPHWEDYFERISEGVENKASSQSVAVVFCGNEHIGMDLEKSCNSYSNKNLQFVLLKENF